MSYSSGKLSYRQESAYFCQLSFQFLVSLPGYCPGHPFLLSVRSTVTQHNMGVKCFAQRESKDCFSFTFPPHMFSTIA